MESAATSAMVMVGEGAQCGAAIRDAGSQVTTCCPCLSCSTSQPMSSSLLWHAAYMDREDVWCGMVQPCRACLPAWCCLPAWLVDGWDESRRTRTFSPPPVYRAARVSRLVLVLLLLLLPACLLVCAVWTRPAAAQPLVEPVARFCQCRQSVSQFAVCHRAVGLLGVSLPATPLSQPQPRLHRAVIHSTTVGGLDGFRGARMVDWPCTYCTMHVRTCRRSNHGHAHFHARPRPFLWCAAVLQYRICVRLCAARLISRAVALL